MRMAQVDSNKILGGQTESHPMRWVGRAPGALGKLVLPRNCIAISKIENIVEDMTEASRQN